MIMSVLDNEPKALTVLLTSFFSGILHCKNSKDNALSYNMLLSAYAMGVGCEIVMLIITALSHEGNIVNSIYTWITISLSFSFATLHEASADQ